MIRRSLIRKRLERLEAVRQQQINIVGRGALVEILPFDYVGERHLVMTGFADAGQDRFQERPGPGPQLVDFGEFAFALGLTTLEMGF
jgi:hypothetical protein